MSRPDVDSIKFGRAIAVNDWVRPKPHESLDLAGGKDSYTTTSVVAVYERGVYLWLVHTHPSSLRALDKMNFLPSIDSHSLVIGHAVTATAWIIGIVCLLGVFA